MPKLSAERVWLSNPQRLKVAQAIREKRNLKLKLRPDQLIGEYPLFVTPNVKSKLQKARILGKGCTCEIEADAMEKTQKAGKGLYDANNGKGMFMFGRTGKVKKSKKAPVLVKAEEKTGNTASSKPTYEEPLEEPVKKNLGAGMYQMGFAPKTGQGVKSGSYGSVLYDFPGTYH